MDENSTPRVTPVTIPGAAGDLAGTLISTPHPDLAVIINAATGVPAAFYHPFAQWLAQTRNAMVLCWDYRDFGASGQPHRSPATMTDWSIADPTAARLWLEQRANGLPMWAIGHSLGGMALAFQPGIERLDRIIAVSAGPGHTVDQPLHGQIMGLLLWYVLGPISTSLLGYLPGDRLGLGSALPRGVFWQWRGWLIKRGNMASDPAIGAFSEPGFSGPLRTVAASDDWMIPPPVVARLKQWHPGATATHITLTPADHGLKRIGHIHAFARRNRVLWPSILGAA